MPNLTTIQRRRIIRIGGRTAAYVPQTYQRTVENFLSIADSTSKSITSGGSNLVAPASGLTYENRIFIDMNFANDSAALAGGIDGFSILGTGERAWVTDPTGSSNVLRTRYNVSEDGSLAYVNFTGSKYVYFQWSEYWHASFGSNMNGKCNRLISRIGGTVYLDHILFGAPLDDYYGGVLQGADDVPDPERTGRSPSLNKGAWYDIALEHKLSTGSDGYWKIYQRTSGGSWTMLPLDFRQYPHTGSDPFLSNQPYFSGRMHTDASHLYNEAWVGGWRSGTVSGTNNYRYIKDMLVLYNVSNAPT